MYTADQLALSGLGLPVIAFIAAGFFTTLVNAALWAMRVLLTSGAYMLFLAWLQFINFNGGWPKDQPPMQEYRPSKSESARVDARIEPYDTMSSRDWDDYHRCLKLNVCVRRFARSSISAPSPRPSSLPDLSQQQMESPDPTGGGKQCAGVNGELRCFPVPKQE